MIDFTYRLPNLLLIHLTREHLFLGVLEKLSFCYNHKKKKLCTRHKQICVTCKLKKKPLPGASWKLFLLKSWKNLWEITMIKSDFCSVTDATWLKSISVTDIFLRILQEFKITFVSTSGRLVPQFLIWWLILLIVPVLCCKKTSFNNCKRT